MWTDWPNVGKDSVSDRRFAVLMAVCVKNTIFGVTLKIEAAGFSETLVPICQTMCRHIPRVCSWWLWWSCVAYEHNCVSISVLVQVTHQTFWTHGPKAPNRWSQKQAALLRFPLTVSHCIWVHGLMVAVPCSTSLWNTRRSKCVYLVLGQ